MVCFANLSYRSFILTCFCRHIVEPFVKCIANAAYKAFADKDEALAFYYQARHENRVRTVGRNPGDGILENNLAI